jgi:hypothetical protein
MSLLSAHPSPHLHLLWLSTEYYPAPYRTECRQAPATSVEKKRQSSCCVHLADSRHDAQCQYLDTSGWAADSDMGSCCFAGDLGRRYEGDYLSSLVAPSKFVWRLTCAQIAFVVSLATIFALGNYLMGSIYVWRMNTEFCSEPIQAEVSTQGIKETSPVPCGCAIQSATRI